MLVNTICLSVLHNCIVIIVCIVEYVKTHPQVEDSKWRCLFDAGHDDGGINKGARTRVLIYFFKGITRDSD